MPEPMTPEVARFVQALESFMERSPRDLPDGALDTITNLRKELRGYTGGDQLSPGEKEAIRAGTGSDEAQPYDRAATGPDQPSPGQKEYEAVVGQIREAVSSLDGNPGS